MNSRSGVVFSVLLVSQFCGTSLWFAGNAILPQLITTNSWTPDSLGFLTSAVQLGFIFGTLLAAVFGIADKFSPSKVFFVSTLIAAGSNVLSLIDLSSFEIIISSRFLTGFFLAGIYPVGMKIAADWSEKGLGFWLGALVGALVLGTAFPQILRITPEIADPNSITLIVSLVCVVGGVMVFILIGDGPFRKPPLKFSFYDISKIYRHSNLRQAAFGYFGHMWELYAFWAFIPWWISSYNENSKAGLNISIWSFVIISFGLIGCLAGGFLSRTWGSKKVAIISLATSGICCLVSPFIIELPPLFFLLIMIFWGTTVVADSPQLSTLVAQSADPKIKGSAITLTTCIGFGITILSIQLLNFLLNEIDPRYLFLLLLPGPLVGVISLIHRKSPNS